MNDALAHANSPAPEGGLVLYQGADGRVRLEIRLHDGTLWLTQAQMAELYGKDVRTINEHLRGIYADRELSEEATIRSFRIVRTEGGRAVTRALNHYRLEAILAVGYRVRSEAGVRFRQWATDTLGEYLVKGFVLNDERLKNPARSGLVDHFDELLERIRDIRASEARMYLRVRDIFALSADYVPNGDDVTRFFQKMQNKLHFAVTGKTGRKGKRMRLTPWRRSARHWRKAQRFGRRRGGAYVSARGQPTATARPASVGPDLYSLSPRRGDMSRSDIRDATPPPPVRQRRDP